MADTVTFDMSGLNRKIAAVKKAADQAAKAAVDYAISEFTREVARNLSGIRHKPGTPSPTPGQLPVSIIMSQLRRSIKIKRLSPVIGIVYADSKVAPYARYVHDGTNWTKKYKNKSVKIIMKKRPFMTAAVQAKKELILKQFKAILKERIQEAGQA